ncbi:rRNA maturation RNase YbeY [Alkaliphilus sp. B6464]|uniref:rRNA maturation RNase YbeY n=1 Tax=Alkaliphilus sp. B6464 TaxID=2731219 RepID=UPI001BAA3CB5|nr:rRNA maturation RNase YbeY [Alkaliphilus sp. B6464]QUH21044.1 rRNA maturation RNase YbeY [Alkaliphilus sp. B6464]
MELLIDNRQNKYEVKEQLIELLEKAVEACLLYENWHIDYEVSLSLVDNNEIKELNSIYRGKDYATDVLSFPLVDEDQAIYLKEKLLGDIVISVEKAEEQAKEYNHSFEREMGFLVVHSMFHLMGYDHDTSEDTKDMRGREEAVLSSLNLIRK